MAHRGRIYQRGDIYYVALGYPFNRSKLRGWVTLVLARTIRSPWASSGPMRTA